MVRSVRRPIGLAARPTSRCGCARTSGLGPRILKIDKLVRRSPEGTSLEHPFLSWAHRRQNGSFGDSLLATGTCPLRARLRPVGPTQVARSRSGAKGSDEDPKQAHGRRFAMSEPKRHCNLNEALTAIITQVSFEMDMEVRSAQPDVSGVTLCISLLCACAGPRED